jgi:hypothetical protein
MSIEHISSAWKSELDIGNAQERFYIDPRGLRYPPLSGHNLKYNTARSDYNFTGTKSAFIGTANYPSSGLVAHYTMDNVTGTTLTDDFGANDGTISGAVQVAGVPGLGRALRFDGVDDNVDTTLALSAARYTFSCWFRKASATASNQSMLFSGGFGSDIDGLMIGTEVFATATPQINITTAPITLNSVYLNGALSSNGASLELDTWYHIVVDATISTIDGGSHYIGSNNNNSNNFHGDIDDVRIYDRALTETEIEYLYNVRANVLSDIEPDYLIDMPETFTLRLVVRPWFDYGTSSNKRLLGWRLDATHRFTTYYDQINNSIQVRWNDGGTERYLASSQFDDGTTYTDLNQWLTIDVAIDLSTGTTAGSQLWINKVSQDTTWSGNITAKVSNFPCMSVGHTAGSVNAQTEYAYAMLIANYVATDADIQNDFNDVKNERIVWDFNGEGAGRTLCDVTDYVYSYSKSAQVEEPMSGSAGANTLSFSLESKDGEFNDDVYFAFDPTNGRYNGLSTQKYLQTRTRVVAETWYSGDWEPFFVGKVDAGLYKRSSHAGGVTTVSVSAEDAVADIATSIQREGATWENYQLADTDEDTSLIHTVARLGTQKNVRNYLSDSGFENATITTAWTAGGSAVIARDTVEEFIGTACAEIDCTAGAGDISQTVLFTGNKALNKGETYTQSVYVKCATAATVTLDLEEHDSSGQNDETTQALAIDATQDYYERVDVTHTITDGDSDRIVFRVNVSSGAVVYADAGMLTQSKRAYDWYVDNTATSKDADDYAESGWDSVGFHVEPTITYTDQNGVIYTDTFTHPWAVINPNESPWSVLKRIADATVALYIGMDASGCFKFRCVLGGWADPETLETISEGLVGGVGTHLDSVSANRIIVRGVYIVKDEFEKYLWGGTATDLFNVSGESVRFDVANGDQFPDPDTFGRFFADLRNVEGQNLTQPAGRPSDYVVDYAGADAINSAINGPRGGW